MKRNEYILSALCVIIVFSMILASCGNAKNTEDTSLTTNVNGNNETILSGTLEDDIFIVGYTGTNGTIIGLTEHGKTLSELNIPAQIEEKNIVSIGEEAFYDKEIIFWNDTITKITLPNGLEFIEDSAFKYCRALKSINIPDSVVYIGRQALTDCFELEYEIYGDLKYLGKWCMQFLNQDTITSAVLKPDTVGIYGGAFNSCPELTKITIPDSVIYIGEWVLSGSDKVEYETYENLKYIGNWCFGTDDKSITSIGFKPGTTGVASSAFSGCTELINVVIPDGVTCISPMSFNGCKKIENITLPDSLKYIGYQTLFGCSKLSAVSLPEGIAYIGESAFGECAALTDIIIPSGISYINCRVFDYCRGLESIKMTNFASKKYVAIDNCLIDQGGKILVAGCRNSIIPDDGSVTALSSHAFLGAGITKITIPKSITQFGNFTFFQCEITNITYIGTKKEWNAIKNVKVLESDLKENEINCIVHCTDGDIIMS